MENRGNIIKGWIEHRLKEKEKPYNIMFSITIPRYEENMHNTPVIKKIQNLFAKYSIPTQFVDTISGSFNLDKEWLETQKDIECFVEYCGVYPINWEIEDVIELERMEYDGEIIIRVNWHVENEYIPNH